MAILTVADTDPLGLSDVQSFFNRRFPPTGGFAVENLGTVTNGIGDFISWPTGPARFGVQGARVATYRAATGGSGQPTGPAGVNIATPGAFINQGTAIGLTNTRVDVDITITALNATGTADINFVVLNANSSTFTTAQTETARSLEGNLTVSAPGRYTITATPTASGDFIWRNGNAIGLFIEANSPADQTQPFTYTVRAVRFSFGPNEYVGREDRLSVYNRGGDIVPAELGEIGYPAMGGIALDDLGTITHGTDNTEHYSWPNNQVEVQGQSAGITYTAMGGTGNLNEADGILTNNTGSDIDLTNARVDARINVTALAGSGEANPELYIRQTGSFNAVFLAFAPVTAVGRYTITDVSAGPITNWANGSQLSMTFLEREAADLPFTYTLDYVRIRFNNNTEEFLPEHEAGKILTGTTADGVGSVTHGATDTTSWPTAAPATGRVQVLGASGITYHTPANQFGGRLYNQTGRTINLTNGRVDISVTVTDFTIDHADVAGRVRIGPIVTANPNTGAGVWATPSVRATPANPTVILTDTTAFPTATHDWISGTNPNDLTTNATLYISISSTGVTPPDERPFTYRVNYVRIRFDGTEEFIIRSLNNQVSEDPQMVQLSQLRNVDDGVL